MNVSFVELKILLIITGMYEVASSSRTLNLVSSLMGEQAAIFKKKINYKFPSGGFKPIQMRLPLLVESTVSYNHDGSNRWCTLENGCQVVKGGANKPIIFLQADGSIKKSYEFQWAPIECKTGDVILFDSSLF